MCQYQCWGRFPTCQWDPVFPEKAHSHLVRAGRSRCLSPSTFTLYHHRARPQRPSTARSEWSCTCHSSSQKSVLLLLPGQMLLLPQDSALGVPPPAPTTHLSTPQHSPYLHPEQVGAETTPILQSAFLSAFRPHMNHTGQTKAQRLLGSSGQRPGVLGQLLLHPLLVCPPPTRTPSHLTPSLSPFPLCPCYGQLSSSACSHVGELEP